jgi:type I restriction enzyme S subunit
LADLYQPETIGSSEFSTSGFLVYGANGVIGQYHRYNHEKPQVTISCRGNCGTVNRTQPFSWITGNAMVVNLEKNRSVDHDFVYHQLREQDYTDIITGSGQPQIVRGPLGAFEISLPPTKAEQTAIADILLDMDTELDALAAKLSKARQIKQGMMQELLTGKTRLV